MDDTVFWMVWNPQRNPPSHRHSLKHNAVREAERLARLHPGDEFYVLEAVELRTVNDMKRVKLEYPIPF